MSNFFFIYCHCLTVVLECNCPESQVNWVEVERNDGPGRTVPAIVRRQQLSSGEQSSPWWPPHQHSNIFDNTDWLAWSGNTDGGCITPWLRLTSRIVLLLTECRASNIILFPPPKIFSGCKLHDLCANHLTARECVYDNDKVCCNVRKIVSPDMLWILRNLFSVGQCWQKP